MIFVKTTKQGAKLPAWYYGKVYENYDTNIAVWTIVGIHTIFKTGRYIHQLWNMYRKRKTWFDKQWLDAYQLGVRTGYFEHANEVSKNKFLMEELRMKLKLPNNQGKPNETIN